MYVITDARTKAVFAIGEKVKSIPGGYIKIENIQYPKARVRIYSGVAVPEGVTPESYCYTAREGFYERNKYSISGSLLAQIKDDTITEIEEAVANADE